MNDHQTHNRTAGWRCDQVREELQAWALGSLSVDESRAIDEHLRGCDACRAEAARWADIARLLPLSLEPVSPSANARTSLMQRIADDQMTNTRPSPKAHLLPASSSSSTAPAQRRFTWIQLLVAPLAIALVVMTAWAMELQEQLDDTRNDPITQVSAMLPETFQAFQMKPECEKCESTGRLLADPQKAEALMVAWDLDPGEVHEVWCEEGDGSRALVANLEVDETGEVVQSLAFDQPISGYNRIYVVSQDGELVEISVNDLLDPQQSPESQATNVH